MESYLPENEYKEFEGRAYVEPQVSLNETNTFIDKLRAAQGTQNEQIKTDTQRLGTDVPSNLGGLLGGEGYFTSRYQTPQTNSAINTLRSAAQASALNKILANEEAMWKKRYQDAYRNYQKRSWNKSNPTTPTNPTPTTPLDIDTNDNPDQTKVSIYEGDTTPSGPLTMDYKDPSGNWWILNQPTSRDVFNTTNKLHLVEEQKTGNVVNKNGVDYMYIDNIPNTAAGWYNVTRSAGPGTYSPRYYSTAQGD